MIWHQKEIKLGRKERGIHLVTDEILSDLKEISRIKRGMLNLFVKHTSCSLSINENADSSVRQDMRKHLDLLIPDGADHFTHISEGPDDMPSHIKTAITDTSLNIPVTNGVLNLGTWQGIYFLEHRDHAGSRKIIATIFGEER